MSTKINIVATGEELLGKGVRATGPLTEELIRNAESSLHIMIFTIAPSGLPILDLLEQAAARGIKISMVVNRIDALSPRVKKRLAEISKPYPHFKVYDFCSDKHLHAKIIVADRDEAVVGSANFTLSGMYRNCEVGIHIQGEESWKLASLVEQVGKNCRSR